MSCKISTAPINISTGVNQPCAGCNITYNFGNSSCSVTNKSTYLDIACFDGENTIEFESAGSMIPSSVKLFRPSLNTYDGFKADAELIITLNGGGKHVYLCIPVLSSEANGISAKWFRQLIPFCPSAQNSSKSINVSNFTLNDVIPKAPFFVYDGGTFDWGCSKNDIMILFNKNKAIHMKSKEYRTLVNLIKKHSYNVLATPKYVTFSKKGTTGGSGENPKNNKDKTLTCTPIVDQYGNNIEGKKTSDFPYTSDTDNKVDTEKLWKNIGLIIAIIGGLALIWGLGTAFSYVMNSDTKSGVLGRAFKNRRLNTQ